MKQFFLALLLGVAYTDPRPLRFTANGTGATQRLQSNKLSDVISVCDFIGNTCPSGADDTTKIQAALDAQTAGKTVLFPIGTYTISSTGITVSKSLTLQFEKGATLTTAGTSAIVVSGATGVAIFGASITLQTNTAGSVQYAINPSGTVSNLLVEGVSITGQATVADGTHGVQNGFGNNSGQTLTDIKVVNSTFTNLNNGISFNADTSGSINGALAQGNYITGMTGTASGSGYGIHHANGSGNPSYVRIIGNEIDSAQRHSIYQAKGSGFVIANNVIRLHRTGVGTGTNLPAILVARSQDGVVNANYMDQPTDGAITVTPETSSGAGNVAYNVVVSNNIIKSPKGFPAITIGTSAPATDGVAEMITVIGNSVYNDTTVSSYSSDLLRIWSGKRIRIADNQLYWLNATGSGGIISIRGSSETAGTASYTDEVQISGNTLYGTNNGGTAFGIHWLAAACTASSRIEVINNRIKTTSNAHFVASTVTDVNVVLQGPAQSTGFTTAVGSSGTITLTAGTGTATVPASSTCVCTDSTANASVQCTVATNTLTATGTAADVIVYRCN